LRKKLTKTGFGSFRVAVVLKRRKMEDLRDYELQHCSQQQATEELEEVPWISTEELVAIKISSWQKIRQPRQHTNKGAISKDDDPVREVAALQLLGNYHPHVVGCQEVLQDDKFLYCVMPYYAKGSNLHTRIFSGNGTKEGQSSEGHKTDKTDTSPVGLKQENQHNRLGEAEARYIFRQLLQSLAYLQRKGIFHRDICLENVLISQQNHVKICDFGKALRVPYSDPFNDNCITDVSEGVARRLMKYSKNQSDRIMYLAPELLADNRAFDGYAADLWAAGVVLFLLCVSLAPFKIAKDSDRNYRKISSGGFRHFVQHLKLSLSREVCDLLQNMLWENPRDRLSLAEVINHPWVMGETWEIPFDVHSTIVEEEEKLEEDLENDDSVQESVAILEYSEHAKTKATYQKDKKIANQQHIPVVPESRESSSEARDHNSTGGQPPSPQTHQHLSSKMVYSTKKFIATIWPSVEERSSTMRAQVHE